jgi:hypothetical protein
MKRFPETLAKTLNCHVAILYVQATEELVIQDRVYEEQCRNDQAAKRCKLQIRGLGPIVHGAYDQPAGNGGYCRNY